MAFPTNNPPRHDREPKPKKPSTRADAIGGIIVIVAVVGLALAFLIPVIARVWAWGFGS